MPGAMVVTERQVYDDLDLAIRKAHDRGELGRIAIGYASGGDLYRRQGETDAACYRRQGETDAACFLWTQAYIFALDAGDQALADAMRDNLAAFGRMG